MRLMRRVVASALVTALAVIPLWSGMSGCAEKHEVAVMIPQTLLPDIQQSGLTQIWQRQLPLLAGEGVKKAWRVGTSVYVASTQSRIFRVEANSGVLAWADGLGEENFEIYRPIELRQPDGPAKEVLIVTRGQTIVVDKITGDTKRSSGLGIGVSSNPVVVGNTLCVGAAEYFYGFYMDNLGTRHWRVPSAVDLFDSSPVAVEDKIIVASRRGYLWRIDPATGSWDTWKDRKTNGPVIGGLVADGRAVYVPCMDQRLYSFAVDSGGELWQAQLSGALDTTPALGGSVVMAVSRDNGLYAVGRQRGDKRWFAEGVVSVGTVLEDRVWVGDNAGNLKSLSLETGDVLASAPIPDAQIFIRNTDDDKVLVVNHGGGIGAYRPR